NATYYIYVANRCDGTFSNWSMLQFAMPSSCVAPENVRATNPSNNSVQLSWQRALDGDETQWQVGYGPITRGSEVSTDLIWHKKVVNNIPQTTITGLAGVTPYVFYVRAICGEGDTSEWSSVAATTTTLMPYLCDFENVDDSLMWASYLLNDQITPHGASYDTLRYPNRWVVGWGNTTEKSTHSGNRSLYGSGYGNINDDGTGNPINDVWPYYRRGTAENDGVDATSRVYAKHLMHLDSGRYDYSYYWRGYAEGGNDHFRLWVMPITTDLVAGNDFGWHAQPTNAICMEDDNYGTWSEYNYRFKSGRITISKTGDYYLTFFWRNDNNGGGTFPSAVIDDFRMSKVCALVQNLDVEPVSKDTALVSWSFAQGDTSWTVEYGPRGFEEGSTDASVYLINLHQSMPECRIENGRVKYVMRNLVPNTDYTVRVRTDCNATGGGMSDAVTRDFTTYCDNVSLPYFEDFNSLGVAEGYNSASGGTVPSKYSEPGFDSTYPACWLVRKNNDSGYPYVFMNSDPAYVSSGNGFEMWVYRSSYAYAILPMFEKPVDSLKISFSLFESSTCCNQLEVGYITDMTTDMTDYANHFVYLTGFPKTGVKRNVRYDFRNDGVDVPANARIVLRYHNNDYWSSHYAVIDDLKVEVAEPCPMLENLHVADRTENSIRLEWTELNNVEGYQVEVCEAGQERGEGRIVSPNPRYGYCNVTGLNQGTRYTFYVSSYCGEGRVGHAESVATTTVCQRMTLPYVEDFEGYGNNRAYFTYTNAGWPGDQANVPLRYNDGDHYLPSCWTFPTMATVRSGYPRVYLVSGTQNDADYISALSVSGDYSLFMHTETDGDAYANMAVLPTMELPIDSLKISFWHRDLRTHWPDGDYGGPLQIGYMSNPLDYTTFVPVYTYNIGGDHRSYFLRDEFDFRHYCDSLKSIGQGVPTGAVIAFKYVHYRGTSTLLLDDIVVDRAPKCPTVHHIRVAEDVNTRQTTLSWAPMAVANRYQIEYGRHGFQPGTGTTV
ncbi:MAG: fibronectin type III domain-containing protein, partial [Bacteroidales bacterium]|nr:fibronectin type III domain-containing protein [Candidatus Colimorpha onthohippi]